MCVLGVRGYDFTLVAVPIMNKPGVFISLQQHQLLSVGQNYQLAHIRTSFSQCEDQERDLALTS